MSPRRTMPVELHESIGLELKMMSDNLCHLGVALSQQYGKTAPVSTAASRLWRDIAKLRCLLDDRLALEHRDVYSTTTYFPGRAGMLS